MDITDAQKIARLTQDLAESRKEVDALQRKLDRVRTAVQLPVFRAVPRICECGANIYGSAATCYSCSIGKTDKCVLCCRARLNGRTRARGVCTKCWSAGLRKPAPINQ